jgi:hypothetical protein
MIFTPSAKADPAKVMNREHVETTAMFRRDASMDHLRARKNKLLSSGGL